MPEMQEKQGSGDTAQPAVCWSVLLAWNGGRLLPSLILASVFAHLGVQCGAIAAPRSTASWGLLVLALGFASLVVGFLVSWFVRPAERAG